MVGTQLALVILAAPAATAGAICLDRARGTLSHMLMTDLSAAEIVLGKLGSRLLPVLSMLVCALPILELLTLLGGRGPDRPPDRFRRCGERGAGSAARWRSASHSGRARRTRPC